MNFFFDKVGIGYLIISLFTFRMWEKKADSIFSNRCTFFFILWIIFSLKKTVPVKLMFWKGFFSQSKSDPFFLYLSTAFYKAVFTCFDTTVFNGKQLLSSLAPLPHLIPKPLASWGWGVCSALSWQDCIMEPLDDSLPNVLLSVCERVQVGNTIFKVACFIKTYLLALIMLNMIKMLNTTFILMCRFICFPQLSQYAQRTLVK